MFIFLLILSLLFFFHGLFLSRSFCIMLSVFCCVSSFSSSLSLSLSLSRFLFSYAFWVSPSPSPSPSLLFLSFSLSLYIVVLRAYRKGANTAPLLQLLAQHLGQGTPTQVWHGRFCCARKLGQPVVEGLPSPSLWKALLTDRCPCSAIISRDTTSKRSLRPWTCSVPTGYLSCSTPMTLLPSV